MKFLLVGHSGSFNRGCEAIIRTTISMLRKEFKDPEIIISTFYHEKEKLIDFGSHVKILPSKKLRGRWTASWMIRQLHKVFSATYRKNYWKVEYLPIISAIEETDLVLSVGGDNYSMDYGFPKYFLNLNRLVKEKKKKLVLWAASIGPFPEDERLKEIIDNLQSVDLITVRETKTLNYLLQLGITKNVKLVADPAFLLPLESVSLEDFCLNNSKGILGITISPILSRYGEKCNSKIIDEIGIFFHKVIKGFGLYILLIPHVMKPDKLSNDYIFMEKIYKQFKNLRMINIISPDYNAMQMKYIISKCNFFIGARTHATIAALSTGVPTLSIGYSVKSKGINKDIFGSYDFLLDINDLSAKTLFDKFTKMVNEKTRICELLSEKIPQINSLARANIKYVREIL